MKTKWIFKGIGIAILAVAGITLFGYVTMSLWNWLVPVLFKGPTITLVQTFGLLLLTRILFGFGKGGRHGGMWREKARGRWKARMESRWANMSDDEREKMRLSFEGRCGHWGQRREAATE